MLFLLSSSLLRLRQDQNQRTGDEWSGFQTLFREYNPRKSAQLPESQRSQKVQRLSIPFFELQLFLILAVWWIPYAMPWGVSFSSCANLASLRWRMTSGEVINH